MAWDWTEELDAQLLALRDDHKLSYREIEARMSRSADSCRTRVRYLKHGSGLTDRNTRKALSAKDDALVKAALQELALALGRTPRAVIWRINRVGAQCGAAVVQRDHVEHEARAS